MRVIQNQEQAEDLRRQVEMIVLDLKAASLYEGRISVERVIPPQDAPGDTLEGYPSLLVREERQTRMLGIVPYHRKRVIFAVKEGFYDLQDAGRKDILVFLNSRSAKAIVRKHLQEFGRRHQVTEVVFKP